MSEGCDMSEQSLSLDERLVRLVLGEVDEAERASLEARMSSDPEALSVFEAAGEIAKLMESGALAEADWGVDAERRSALSAMLRHRPEGWLSQLDRTVERVAMKVYDSIVPGMAVQGLRGGMSGRHLVFEAEGCTSDLRISSDDEAEPTHVKLTGQIVADEAVETVRFEPLEGGEPVTFAVDADGMFHGRLEPGRFDAVIAFPTSPVVLAGIDLNA